MKRITNLILLGSLVVCFSIAPAMGMKPNLLVGELASLPIAPQTKLAVCDFSSPQTVSVGRATLEVQSDGLVKLRGKNDDGRPWVSTYAAEPGAGCELWEANVGANTSAFFLVLYGMNSSGGWDTTLSVLNFDNHGDPFPWQAQGYVEVGSHGVKNIILLNDSRAIGVIVATQEKHLSAEGESHRNEYRIYKLSQNGINEINGVEKGIHWPYVSANANEKWADHSPRFNLSVVHNLDQNMLSTEAINTTQHKVQGVRDIKDAGPEIVTSDANIPLPDVLVVDSPSGRNIVSDPQLSDFTGLKISNATAKIFGNNCVEDTCHPVVVWIK